MEGEIISFEKTAGGGGGTELGEGSLMALGAASFYAKHPRDDRIRSGKMICHNLHVGGVINLSLLAAPPGFIGTKRGGGQRVLDHIVVYV